MTMRHALAVLVLAGAMTPAFSARAEDDDVALNLKVLRGTLREIEAAMKPFSKGLGADNNCFVCHVKGEFESDKLLAKEDGRKFLRATVGEKDKERRVAALKALLAALKIDKAKDEAKLWTGVDAMKKK